MRDQLSRDASSGRLEAYLHHRKGEPTGEWNFNAAGTNRALELAGRHTGMFQEHANATPSYHLHIPEGMTIDDLRVMRDAIMESVSS